MTRDRLRHLGPPAEVGFRAVHGHARSMPVSLPAGQTLMEAVADVMDRAGCDSAALTVDGMAMGPFAYVMPDTCDDGVHAAWYSETREGSQARIRFGTAIVGRRDGAWWLHCHAVWEEAGAIFCGHLLPDRMIVVEDSTVMLHTFDGGRFEVALDEETRFPIFHPVGSGKGGQGNALLAKVNPHHDVHGAITAMIEEAGFENTRILGIGSLIGARFAEGGDMASPISEVLVLPGAHWNGRLHLPMHCVDPEGRQFDGVLQPGGGPVCVTFELMIVEDHDPPNDSNAPR
ncbi:DUF296 domain-containing protein [Primorskyibacter sp. 2E107]|uniref:DUF296 domain-containing protein n=1 Tax=Primorskyibacter sp. 2E107 TaxID=3403458 RepID=UPI003AF7902C